MTAKQLGNKVVANLLENGFEIRQTRDFSGAIDFGRFSEARGLVKGYVFPDDLVILINKDQSPKEKLITLIHETLHDLFPRFSEPKIEKTALSVYRALSDENRSILTSLLEEPTLAAAP